MNNLIKYFFIFILLIASILFLDKPIFATPKSSTAVLNNDKFVLPENIDKLIQGGFNSLKTRISQIETILTQHQTAIDLLKQRVDSLEKEVESLKNRVSDLENKKSVISGEMHDANAPQVGLIQYVGTAEEFHFWFRPNTGVLGYIAGHYYHVIYKRSPENPQDWCDQIPVGDRPPYNLFGSAGELVYFKIIDTTTNRNYCF